MKRHVYLFIVFFVASMYGQEGRWLQGRLVTENNNVKTPIKNTIVTILETGDKDKTDQNGKFRIKLKESIIAGDKISVSVEKEKWAIHYPLNGEFNIPNNLEKSLTEIEILPMGSKLFLSHDDLEKLFTSSYKKRKDNNPSGDEPSTFTLTKIIKGWAEQYGLTVEAVQLKVNLWLKELEKNKEDEYKLGLAEFVKGNYEQAGNHFNSSAVNKVEQLNEFIEKQKKLSKEIIRDFQKAGESFAEIQNYNQAITAFENALKYIDKNQNVELWVNLIMDRAFYLGKQSTKDKGPELLKNINAAIEAYDSIFYSYNANHIKGLVLWNKGAMTAQKARFQKGSKSIQNLKIGLTLLKESLNIYQKENDIYGMSIINANIMICLGSLAFNSVFDSTFYYFFEGLKFSKEEIKGLDLSDLEKAIPMNNRIVFNLHTRRLTNDDPLKRMLSATLSKSKNFNHLDNDFPRSWLPILKKVESFIYSDSISTYLKVNDLSTDINTLKESISILLKEGEQTHKLSYARNNFAWALIQKSFSLSNHDNILHEALDTLQNNLIYITKEEYPQDWAITQNNIGLIKILISQKQEKTQANKSLNKAIEIFNQAFEIYDERYFPNGFADTKMYLGIAYKELALIEENVNKMYYHSSALKSFKRSTRSL